MYLFTFYTYSISIGRNGRINEMLEVSRAFGDYTFKKSGVISVPEFRRVQLTKQHRYRLD